jgi:L-ascorbate metabolism protein UlaG (beta-lactamase superfamily)
MLKPHGKKTKPLLMTAALALTLLVPWACSRVPAAEPDTFSSPERITQASDHFDGNLFFNPSFHSAQGGQPRRGSSRWIWRWIFGFDRPEWPEEKEVSPGSPPPARLPVGSLRVTSIGHATFLIQMDGLNILTDPIWSDRCSPVSWTGPRRRQKPGILFEDLPVIDAVLISHNHYDHLDLPTLKGLAKKGAASAVVPLDNLDLVKGTGISEVHELDWWQSIRLSSDVTVTLVPARHFSSRSLWDRNKTLWGGFVVSGPSGNVFFAGDTGYGPHFQEIARRFSPIRVALLPISPFRPPQSKEPPRDPRLSVHMGPAEAVQAHRDLGAGISIAAHFQVFQLGWDGFDDAVKGLAAALSEYKLNYEAFLALNPGQFKEVGGTVAQRVDGTKPPFVRMKGEAPLLDYEKCKGATIDNIPIIP